MKRSHLIASASIALLALVALQFLDTESTSAEPNTPSSVAVPNEPENAATQHDTPHAGNRVDPNASIPTGQLQSHPGNIDPDSILVVCKDAVSQNALGGSLVISISPDGSKVEREADDAGVARIPTPSATPARVEASHSGSASFGFAVLRPKDIQNGQATVQLFAPRTVKGQLTWMGSSPPLNGLENVTVSAWDSSRSDVELLATTKTMANGLFSLSIPSSISRVVLYAGGNGVACNGRGTQLDRGSEDQDVSIPVYFLQGLRVLGKHGSYVENPFCTSDNAGTDIFAYVPNGSRVFVLRPDQRSLVHLELEQYDGATITSVFCASSSQEPTTLAYCHEVAEECVLKGDITLEPFIDAPPTAQGTLLQKTELGPLGSSYVYFVPPAGAALLDLETVHGTLILLSKEGAAYEFPIKGSDLLGLEVGCVPEGTYRVLATFLEKASYVPRSTSFDFQDDGTVALPVVQVPSTNSDTLLDLSGLGVFDIRITKSDTGPAFGHEAVWMGKGRIPESLSEARGRLVTVQGPRQLVLGAQTGKYYFAPVVLGRPQLSDAVEVEVVDVSQPQIVSVQMP